MRILLTLLLLWTYHPILQNSVDTNTAPTVDIPPDTPELPVDTNTTSRPASRTPSRSITPDRASESPNQDEEQSRDSAPPVVGTRRSS